MIAVRGTELTTLEPSDWHCRRTDHERRVDAWTEPRLRRMSLGEKHPIDDFLFEYYSLRPAQLRRWHPGIGTAITGDGAEEFLALRGYRRDGDGAVTADPFEWKPERRAFVFWLRDLLVGTRDRPAAFGCHGLHEWAMVYRAGEVRHGSWPLRLGAAGTDAVVESLPIRCSHYDAFRFFTPDAAPMNRLQPTRPTSPVHEQSGCLHTNMDLYKWAYKLLPFAPSELVADTFALAREIRTIDMRASPYDFTRLGMVPIPIETEAGRSEYANWQRHFSRRSEPVRNRLLAVTDALIAAW